MQGYDLIKFPLARWRAEPLKIPFTFSKLLGLARRLKPDVVFASIPPAWPMWEGYLLAKRLGVPFVLDVRDLPQGGIRAKSTLIHAALKTFQINSLKRLAVKASRITTVTDWFKKELVEFLNCPSHLLFVVRNGSETSIFAGGLSVKKEFDLVYSGTFIAIRNPPAILQYLRALRELYPSFRILFISSFEGTIGKGFLPEISCLGLSNNVVIQKMCAPNELPEHLGKGRLSFTSLKSQVYPYKGVVSAKNYEYLAAGLPIIGLLDPYFYTEAERLIMDNRVGILHPDPKRLAEETAALLKDSARLRRMSKRARKVGERFDRKRLAEECYYKVILPAWKEFNARKLGGR
jgi:glycosyltransferase involved in cell wall biosynthesis